MRELAASVGARSLLLLALSSTVGACASSPDEAATVSIASAATSVDTSAGSSQGPSAEASTVAPAPTTPAPAGNGDPATVIPPTREHPQPVELSQTDFGDVFGTFVGGGDPVPDCAGEWDSVPSTPYIGPGRGTLGTLTRGVDLQICVAGFDLAVPIELTVADPSGAQRMLHISGGSTDVSPTDLLIEATGAVTLRAEGGYLATRVGQIEPTTPLGQYRLIARQGDRQTEVTPTVVPYPVGDPAGGWLKPQLDLADRPDRRAGDTIRILFLGFGPNVTVPLAVYRPAGEAAEGGVKFAFVQELPAARVNAEGWSHHDIVIPDGLAPMTDHPGYCIVTTPALAPSYCQPSLDPLFTVSGDAPATTGIEPIETAATTETTETTSEPTTSTTSTTTTTTMEATTTAAPTTAQSTTPSSAPPLGTEAQP